MIYRTSLFAYTIFIISLCAFFPAACRRNDSEATAEQGKTTPTLKIDATYPNVVLISVDTLRADHITCYGYHRPTTPRIDRLAADGVVFLNTISSTSWTLPAHAALFTGLADTVHACTNTDKSLHPSRHTLAERLGEVGYATAGFFSGPYLHPVFGLAQGFQIYQDCTSYADFNTATATANDTIEGPAVWQRSSRDVTNPTVYNAVSNWLQHNTRRPFLLFIHLWDAHYDFIPPPPDATMFDAADTGTITGENFRENPRVVPEMPQRDLDHLIALYDGEIAWTDAHVGKILDDLEVLDLNDSTIIVLTSDHGTAFFEHGQKGHRNTLYDELIRIPLVIRYPKAIPAGLRIEEQARLIDVLPTLLDLIGLPRSDDMMGQTLTPLFSGGRLARSVPAVSELFSLGLNLRSNRRNEYKLIYDEKNSQGVVFDLRVDPAEQSVLKDTDSPVVKAAVRDRQWTAAWIRSFRKALPIVPTTSQIPPQVLQQLKTLGYIGGDGNTSPSTAPPNSRP